MVAEIRKRVEDLISTNGFGQTVIETVANHFAKIEIDRRVGLLIDGMKRLNDAEIELSKVKPDHIIFDVNGAVLNQGYTTNQKSKRDKSIKLVDRCTSSINDAIANGNFKSLEELLKNSGSSKDE